MYNNIGGKIKGLAKFIAYAGIGLSVLIGFVMILEGCDSYYGENISMQGLLILILGSLSSWISSWFMYGFGELIEKVTIISEGTLSSAHPSTIKKDYGNELGTLKRWRDSGLIAEEEYQEKVNKIIEAMNGKE